MSRGQIVCFKVNLFSPSFWGVSLTLIGCTCIIYKAYSVILTRLDHISDQLEELKTLTANSRSIGSNTDPIEITTRGEDLIEESTPATSDTLKLDKTPIHYKATTDISSRLIKNVR